MLIMLGLLVFKRWVGVGMTGGRNPVEDNVKGINLCVDLMLTEAIDDLKSKDRTCKRTPRPNFNFFNSADGSNNDLNSNSIQEI